MQAFDISSLEKAPQSALLDMSDEAKKARLLKTHKISESEYQTLLSILERQPTFAELGVFSAMWSEHCSYKSSRIHLGRFPTEGEQVVVGPGENAGVVRLFEKLCVAFKMESHNHPSYIEPYQGAATGVGGILRDVFCMGSRPVANLNCLRFGARDHVKTPWLLSHVVKGIGDYGNCVGIPTVGGNVSFDACYDGNCLVNAMTVGLIEEDKIFKGFASGVGNLVIYVGSATGRDGIHGATMASDSFDSESSQERGAVQVGDPFTEKLLLEATLEVLDKGLVVGIQDMGAAGLTSSSFEMADRAETGLFLDLDRVPVRAEKMTAYELLLSESQERMLMVIRPENWIELEKVLEKWQLSYGVIGKVTDTGRMQAHYQGKLEVDVPVAPLATKAPKYQRPLERRARITSDQGFQNKCNDLLEKKGIETILTDTLSEMGETKPIYRQYDHHIGTSTRFGPESGGAALLWIRHHISEEKMPYLGLSIATNCNERYCRNNPRLGGSYAVLKAARSIAATASTPLAITDCLNFGNPEDPEVMWEFSEAVDGISEACLNLNTPVVSGNVSLYNETDKKSIYPTPMIGMVGKIDDVRVAKKAVVEEPSRLYLLSKTTYDPSFCASVVAKICRLEIDEGDMKEIDWQSEKDAFSLIENLSKSDLINAAKDVGRGGVLAALLGMSIKSGLGLNIETREQDRLRFYFGEQDLAYVLASNSPTEQLNEVLKAYPKLSLTPLGEATKTKELTIDGIRLPYESIVSSYQSSLPF